MPLIEISEYKAPFWIPGGHAQTILPALFRKVNGVNFRRERIPTPDGDYLYTDWLRRNSKKLAILSHGLEGNSGSGYILGMAKMLNQNGLDVLAWNHRMCAGEVNNSPRMYHSGNSEDLHVVINDVINSNTYTEIVLIGFSMGGNINLKYLGENQYSVPDIIKKAVVFSVPCDLAAAGEKLRKLSNRIYLNRFLTSLKQKIREKHLQMPELISNIDQLTEVRNFQAFDEMFTAPLHGFKNAEDYYTRSSSKQFIQDIKIPTLIVNALNDPFLAEECFPIEEAKNNKHVLLEMPENGGHVGFMLNGINGQYWSEKRTLEFLEQ